MAATHAASNHSMPMPAEVQQLNMQEMHAIYFALFSHQFCTQAAEQHLRTLTAPGPFPPFSSMHMTQHVSSSFTTCQPSSPGSLLRQDEDADTRTVIRFCHSPHFAVRRHRNVMCEMQQDQLAVTAK